MHHIFHTKGIIVGGRAVSDRARTYRIFTREHGMVFARASGVRTPASKLKASLVDFSCGAYAFVKGRHDWKLTNAVAEKNFFFETARDSRAVLLRATRLLVRLLPGEEPNPALYDLFENGCRALVSGVSKEALPAFECGLVLQMLSRLGYVGELESISPYLLEPFTPESLKNIGLIREQALLEINRALRASNL